MAFGSNTRFSTCHCQSAERHNLTIYGGSRRPASNSTSEVCQNRRASTRSVIFSLSSSVTVPRGGSSVDSGVRLTVEDGATDSVTLPVVTPATRGVWGGCAWNSRSASAAQVSAVSSGWLWKWRRSPGGLEAHQALSTSGSHERERSSRSRSSCCWSSSLNPRPCAPARNRSSTAQVRLRQLVSPGSVRSPSPAAAPPPASAPAGSRSAAAAAAGRQLGAARRQVVGEAGRRARVSGSCEPSSRCSPATSPPASSTMSTGCCPPRSERSGRSNPRLRADRGG